MRQVSGPVQVGVMRDLIAAEVSIPVDEGCDAWELGNEVHGVLIDGIPVVFLGGTLCIRLGKAALRLRGQAHLLSATLQSPTFIPGLFSATCMTCSEIPPNSVYCDQGSFWAVRESFCLWEPSCHIDALLHKMTMLWLIIKLASSQT